MEQLTTLDASFLKAEDSDRHVSLAIGGVAVIDGSAPDHDALTRILAERICAIPRCTQVLRTYPFDVAAPEWVEDPGFDLSRHVKRVALPHPGDDTELFRVVADVLERRLDRDRPLWECWIIEGLQGNRWAILIKIHHCVADGISATHILAGLSDTNGGDTSTKHAPHSKHSSNSTGRTWTSHPPVPRLSILDKNPLDWADDAWRAAMNVTDTAARTASGAAKIVAGLIWPAAASSLNGPVTTSRRYHAVRVPRKSVDNVCRKFGVTLNDVALAAITEGFREVLLQRGEAPRADSLRTLVPVSVRSADALDQPGNRISVMLPYLPVELHDPVQRLRTVHTRLSTAKHSGQHQAGSAFVSAANFIPFMLSSWMIRLFTRLPQRGIVTLATNVPGPRHRLEIMGQTVLSLLPIPPIALRLRTGVAVLSYADELVFGITADYDAAADVEQLVTVIERSVAQMDALSRGSVVLFPGDRSDGRRPAEGRPADAEWALRPVRHLPTARNDHRDHRQPRRFHRPAGRA